MSRVTRTAPAPARVETGARHDRRRLLLIGFAIVLTGLNLRTAVNSVGPVLEELQRGLGLSSGEAGLVTTMPVICFALIGFAGPPLSARFRDGHVLAGALTAMAAGLVLRALAPAFGIFLAGTVLAMVGGALGNVLLPALVKKHFPRHTGLLVGAYSTALSSGGAVAAVAAAPIAGSLGDAGWRWALGIWALLALVAAVPWLAVKASPGARPGRRSAVRLRAFARSPLAVALAVFFGLQSLEAYVLIGWSAQYLRDSGLSAGTAGLLLGINSVVVIPLNAVVAPLTVRPRAQRPLLAVFVLAYAAGWIGLWRAPLTLPWLWMILLAVGMGSFAMVLALLGMRARTPETTAGLSTVAQGWGYLLAGFGPLLVGVLHGATGSYTGMFVLVLAGALGLGLSGLLVTRNRYVDDELRELRPVPAEPADADVVEVAGAEPPVTVHLREPDGASRRG
jgi:CP family cyanate transporter-like MFS transporter